MEAALQINERIDLRVQNIMDWVRAHKVQISEEENVEIVLNISGNKVKGKYTCFPKWAD